ncbi:glycoside hydrolase family 140 protein [Aestuariibaculum sp. M13]|uniref:glycoside hydrolase family 140 protein n=1 Tax=Aestuariibaculum sp. M13 TaxID=2967132 RepID=UPI002159D213|nr:glycoside hydrolase family 140 protein [Aestuariibaculum sp. M13]MCR8666755.1 glycoside hydrolase family 140 protein [Aestuariibaculum sp. M13]
MKKRTTKLFRGLSILGMIAVMVSCKGNQEKKVEEVVIAEANMPNIEVSENGHYFQTEDGKPFFYLGDTGWLAFNKLNREELGVYFKDRKDKGYNVIQIMTIHSLNAANVYGDSALVNKDLSKPLVTEGNDFNNEEAYDFWDHVDYALDVAKENDLYLGMVPIWGSPVTAGEVSIEQAKAYANFLAERFQDRDNIIWLVGGDTFGNQNTELWNAIGSILKAKNPKRMVTFHPRGRTDSSDDFHNVSWLDFNMFQSGHRRYDQDDTERNYGEDNYKFVNVDFNLKPTKPTLDGEPSYEGIPQGLHDTLQPHWKAKDLRRYGYWSVFAGAAGFTYGNNHIMQMHANHKIPEAYGSKTYWVDALNDPGAGQMVHLKDLMLKFDYFNRIPDSALVANQGEKYDYIAATRGNDYALFYTYTGRTIKANMGIIEGGEIEASWYNPSTGETTSVGTFKNEGVLDFDAPGEQEEGNDWVLVLTTKK